MSTPNLPPAPPAIPPQSPYAPPSAGGPPPPGDGKRLPWEERERLGIVEALVQTVRLLVTEPVEGFSRLRPDGDLTSPILFGIILSWVAMALSQFWQVLFGNPLRSLFSAMQGFEGVSDVGVGGVIGILVFWPILFIVFLFIGSGIVHLCLMLVGATDQSPSGFEGTLKVVSYAQIAGLASIVPFLGGMVVLIWSLILEVLGFAAVHRTTQGRALAGVLIPVIFCCVCGALVMVFFGAMIAAIIAGAARGT